MGQQSQYYSTKEVLALAIRERCAYASMRLSEILAFLPDVNKDDAQNAVWELSTNRVITVSASGLISPAKTNLQ